MSTSNNCKGDRGWAQPPLTDDQKASAAASPVFRGEPVEFSVGRGPDGPGWTASNRHGMTFFRVHGPHDVLTTHAGKIERAAAANIADVVGTAAADNSEGPTGSVGQCCGGPEGSPGEPPSAAVETYSELVATLEWYREQARLCRLIHGDGDKGRIALAADGGKRAGDVLAKTAGCAIPETPWTSRQPLARKLPTDVGELLNQAAEAAAEQAAEKRKAVRAAKARLRTIIAADAESDSAYGEGWRTDPQVQADSALVLAALFAEEDAAAAGTDPQFDGWSPPSGKAGVP